jgi:hypothetical protein
VAKLKGKAKAAFLRRMAAGRKKATRRPNTGKKSTARKVPKMRKLANAGTGWIQATRVKIVRKRGRPAEVLIQRPKRRK